MLPNTQIKSRRLTGSCNVPPIETGAANYMVRLIDAGGQVEKASIENQSYPTVAAAQAAISSHAARWYPGA